MSFLVPHKVIMFFKIDAHKMLPDGRCSGEVKETTGNIILSVDCNNEDEAIHIVKKLAAEIRKNVESCSESR